MPRTNAQRKYDAANLKKVMISINKNTESEILAKLENVPHKATYIKDLIRADLEGRVIRKNEG